MLKPMTLDQLPAPQQARAVATRTRILDATIACLTARGVTGATTTAIARQAGVSQGALYKHFTAKPLLMAAATEHLFSTMRDDFSASLAEAPKDDDSTLFVFDVLWQTYTDPRLQGVFELYLAARTDPDLHAVLEPVVSEHFDAIVAIARGIFPEVADTPRFDDTVHAILLTMHGAALMAGMLPQGPHSPRLHRDFIRSLARQYLGAPTLEAP